MDSSSPTTVPEAASPPSYWCYSCERFVHAAPQGETVVVCPDCDGGFLEEMAAPPRRATVSAYVRRCAPPPRALHGNGLHPRRNRRAAASDDRLQFMVELLVLVAGAACLLLISLKFRRVLDLAAADLAFSSPSSSDHLLPLPGSSSSNSNATPLFQVQSFCATAASSSLTSPTATAPRSTAWPTTPGRSASPPGRTPPPSPGTLRLFSYTTIQLYFLCLIRCFLFLQIFLLPSCFLMIVHWI